jgi:hypothetical protein
VLAWRRVSMFPFNMVNQDPGELIRVVA